MHFCSLTSNWSIASCIKPRVIKWNMTSLMMSNYFRQYIAVYNHVTKASALEYILMEFLVGFSDIFWVISKFHLNLMFKPFPHRDIFCKQSRPRSGSWLVRAAWLGSTLFAYGNMTYLILHLWNQCKTPLKASQKDTNFCFTEFCLSTLLKLLSFYNLFSAITFISSIIANVFAMKVVEETFRQLLQKVWCLWPKQIFVYKDEDFAINWISPKFLSLLLTDKIRIVLTEMGSLKKYL